MTVARFPWLARVLLVAFAVAFVLTACGDDPPSAPEAADSQTAAQQTAAETADAQPAAQQSTTTQQSTAQQSATTETSGRAAEQSTQEPTAVVADLEIEINRDTLWQEVFDTLTDSEQSCLRSELGADQLESALRQPFLSEDDPQQWEVTAFACLAPEIARALFLASITAELQEEADVELSESELSCLGESIADFDPAAALAAAMSEAEDQSVLTAFLADFFNCIPNYLLTVVLSEFGAELEDLSADEVACLQEWAADTDLVAVIEAEEDSEASEAIVIGFLACVPSLLTAGSDAVGATSAEADAPLNLEQAVVLTVGQAAQGTLADESDRNLFAFEAEPGQLYEMDVSLDTLEDSVITLYDADGWELAYNDDQIDSLASRIVWRASASGSHYVQVAGYGSGSYTLTVSVSDLVDDHGDSAADATAVAAGEAIPSALEYAEDSDYFSFEAEQGQLYQIDVSLDTLEDSVIALYDADGWELAFSDDYADSLASRIVWRASASGLHYVQVSGYGSGSYTLTVSVSDIVDDHGDSIADATAVTVGEAIPGALEYAEDSDYFSFEAEQGQLYQIDVSLDTLEDSVIALYDADGQELAYNDDHADSLASRIDWEAPASVVYYLEVRGYSAPGGSYTVTIAAR